MSVFHFPDVGEGIHEGKIVEWLVTEGEEVEVDQPLLKVETDKAVVELPSPEAGTLLKLHSSAGDVIFVGDPLVTIGVEGDAVEAESTSTHLEQSSDSAEASDSQPIRQDDVVGDMPAIGDAQQRPLATPRTRVFAREMGVDLTQVSGTGKRGRITNEDVERAAQGETSVPDPTAAAPETTAAPLPSPPPQSVSQTTGEGEVERVPVSHLRKMIANAMTQSKKTAAHVTHVDEADVTELVELYKKLKPQVEATGVKFSLLAFFVKALVTVLRQHPIFNATVDEEAQEIVFKKFYNIGIAVDTPEGLIVPVIKNAERKDMVTIAEEIADLAGRARERSLGLDEIRGGTCTITNIGPLGGVFATPIINQPELAIVGLHSIKERPAVVDGEIAIRKQMYLSVSFDHRYIDGAQGARFMSDLVDLVSNPELLMVRI